MLHQVSKTQTKYHRIIFGGAIFSVVILLSLAMPLHTSIAPSLTMTGGSLGLSPKVLGVTDGTQNLIRGQGQTLEIAAAKPLLQVQSISLSGANAKSILIYDVATGSILAEKNPKFPLPIASLTKLMTAFVSYNHSNFNESVTITGDGVLNVSPTLGLKPGEVVTTGDLFNSMMVGSANDAALSLATYISHKTGTKFSILMNDTALELHMTDSHFSNPMGFDSDTNYSTAEDLRLLVDAARRYEAFSLMGRKTNYSFANQSGRRYAVRATNTLLADPEISAIKTGFTPEAQGSMITEINHNSHIFIIILIGSPSREQDTLFLKKEIISNYHWAE